GLPKVPGPGVSRPPNSGARARAALRHDPTMAQLTFPIPSGELTLAVVIGHNRKALTALLAAGQAFPSPIWTMGVIDTGSNITCVTPTVLQRLALSSSSQSSSQTVGGP